MSIAVPARVGHSDDAHHRRRDHQPEQPPSTRRARSSAAAVRRTVRLARLALSSAPGPGAGSSRGTVRSVVEPSTVPRPVRRLGFGVASVVANAMGYVLSVLLARRLSPDDFGAMGALLALGILGTIPSTAIQLSVVAPSERRPDPRGRVSRSSALRARPGRRRAVRGLRRRRGAVGVLPASRLRVARRRRRADPRADARGAPPATGCCSARSASRDCRSPPSRCERRRGVAPAVALALGGGVTAVLVAMVLGAGAAAAVAAPPVRRGGGTAADSAGHGHAGMSRGAVVLTAYFLLTNVDVPIARHHLTGPDSGTYAWRRSSPRSASGGHSSSPSSRFPGCTGSEGARRRGVSWG